MNETTRARFVRTHAQKDQAPDLLSRTLRFTGSLEFGAFGRLSLADESSERRATKCGALTTSSSAAGARARTRCGGRTDRPHLKTT